MGSNWMGDFCSWLERDGRSKSRKPLSKASIDAYKRDALHLARFAGDDFQPGFLTEDLVSRYFAAQGDAAPKSANRRLASLRILVRWAIGCGLLNVDPTIRQGRVSEESLPPRAKRADEMKAMGDVLTAGGHLKAKMVKSNGFLGLRDQVIFALAAKAGFRESEIAALKLAGVDLEGAYLTVRGKGGHVGHVKVSKDMVSLLERWFTVHPGGEFVVCDLHGNQLSRCQVWRRIVAVGKAAGVNVRPHDLRHGFCLDVMRSALKDGQSPENALDAVRRQARHRDERTSMKYLRATDGDLERIMDAL
jgi:integrase/recombinase XerD